MMADDIVLNTLAGPVSVPTDGLLVFLDETGGETLADRNHPVFGLGGCVVRADAYRSSVDAPWREMKARAFPNKRGPLHASKDRFTGKQKAAVSAFFQAAQVGRMAAVISCKAQIEVTIPNFQLVVAACLKRLDALAPTFWPFSEVHVIVESAQRTNPLIQRFLGAYDHMNAEDDGVNTVLPFHKYFADKAACLAGLEIADLVMHAAGACVREEAKTVGSGRARRDFETIFRSAGPHLASFLQVSSVSPPNAV
jgi:hypothetical protein